MKNLFLITTSLLIFCSCHSNNEYKKRAEDTFIGFKEIIKNPDSIPEITVSPDNLQVIEIPSDINKTSLNLDAIIDSVYYIKLETNPDCLIGSIDKILFFNDKILIIENLQRKSVLMFNDNGKFVKKIGTEGRGPGEYVTIRDVALDINNKSIVFLDDYGGKLLFYDLDGNFVTHKKLYYYPTAFSILNDDSFLFYQGRSINIHIPAITEYNLLFSKSDQSISGKAISYSYRDKYKSFSMGSLHSFNASENGVMFCPPYANEIYKITGRNNVVEKYTLNIGPKDVLNAMGPSTTNDDFTNLLNTGNYYYFDGPAIESDNFLYFYIGRGGDCFFSKKTKKLFYGNSYRFNPDSTKVLSFTKPITVKNNYFVSIIVPNRLVKGLKYRKTNEFIQKVIINLHEEDNPILFFYTLKNL